MRPGGPAGLGVGARSLNQFGMVTVYTGCSTGVKSLKFRSSAPIRSLVAMVAADRLLYTAQAEVPPRRVMERPSDSWILRPNFPRENYQNFTEKPGGTPSGRYC